MSNEKKIIIIAGPNGAGKTTFAREFLPAEAALPFFVNADLIAQGLSPFDPDAAAIRAGRLMLAEIDAHAAAGRSFAFETTLSGHTYLHRIDRWRGNGYVVKRVSFSQFARGSDGPCRGTRTPRRPSRAIRCDPEAIRQRHEKLS